MSYRTEVGPYPMPLRGLTPARLRKVFAAIEQQLPRRIQNISDFIYAERGVLITPSSSDEVIDQLPGLIASLGGLVILTEAQFEARIAHARPQAKDALRTVMNKEALDEPTQVMVFDGALLWGEVFRTRYHHADWTIYSRRKSSVDYGNPILVPAPPNAYFFNPFRELYGKVGLELFGTPSRNSLSRIMLIRAFEFGLGPDPF